MPSNDDNDRRQFYRVEDRVGLEYRRVEGAPSGPVATLFEGAATLVLHEEVRRYDNEIRAQLNQLAETDRNLSHLLKALNDKLDTVARIMTFEQKPLQDEHWVDVTISEGGISFQRRNIDFSEDETLAVRLTFIPELTQVAVLSRVVRVEPLEGAQRAHLEFIEMEDHERQLIARHVLRTQARQRQQQRGG